MNYPFKRLFGALLTALILSAPYANAQQSFLTCSKTAVPFVNTSPSTFVVTRSSATTGSGVWLGTANVINNNLTDFASGTFAVTAGSLTLSVADATNDYNAGDFAGFVVSSSAISLNVLGSLTVRTYLNGALQESKTANGLLAVGSSLIAGAYEVGYYTNLPFDRVEITATSTAGLAGYNVYYAILRGTGSCTSPALGCNANTALSFPTYPAVVDPQFTGVTGLLTVSAISNADNAVDNDPATYASLNTTASVAGVASFAVKDVVTDYAAGTYAGFDIYNPTLLGLNALGNITIATYRNSVLQEQQSGNNLLLGASVLGGGGRQKVGFVTTLSFDEVQVSINQPAVGVDLGETRIYGAIFKRFCAGPALSCNTPTVLNETVQPVYINLVRTGKTGAVCAACTIDSTGNVIDGDANTAATISLTAGALTSGSIAVKNALEQYDSGSFAGFDIENTALLNVNALNNIAVSTYLNGVLQDNFTGNSLLAGASTNLLGAAGRLMVGNLTTKKFDEVRLTATQTASVNLGITKVYSTVLTKFCGGTIGCNSTYWLTNPGYPVFVDGLHTGVTGAVCAACNVSNTGNVLTAATNDYSTLTTIAGIASSSSLSVHDVIATYPAGTIAGFAIRDPNNFLQVSLLKSIRITTYKKGVLQESGSGGQLLNLSAIILSINGNNGLYNLGLKTSLPFDEVQISATPVAGVVPVLDVYGAFVDTRYLDSVANGVLCSKPPIAESDHVATIINTPVNGNLKTNDADAQGQVLTYNTTPATQPAHGSVVINADGTFTYTPANNYVGNDTFQYTVCNTSTLCATQYAIVSVMPARTPGGSNMPPMVQNDYNKTVVGLPVKGNAQNNDNDPDGNMLTYTVVRNPAHGTLSLNSNGSYLYTPDSSFIGTDTAGIQICDNGSPSLCTTSKIYIEVIPHKTNATNDPPFAQDDVNNTTANTNVTGNVLNNDSDPNGSPLTATLLDAVGAGTGTLYFGADGSYTFIPANGFTGSFSVRYAACDGGTPAMCDTATLTITVQRIIGPDFTPTITIDNTVFTQAGVMQDFYVSVTELQNAASNGQVVVKILKPSAFTTTYSATTTSSNANGGTAVQNSDWTITENSIFITCTLKPAITITGSGVSKIGFSISRKANIATNTMQNMTTTIVSASGGDSNNTNNQFTVNLTAQ